MRTLPAQLSENIKRPIDLAPPRLIGPGTDLGDRIEAGLGRPDPDSLWPLLRLLPAEDRKLVELTVVRGLSQRAAAQLMKLSPGVVARRSLRLRNLLASPTRRAIAQHLDALPPGVRQIAIDHFFARMGVNVLCERLGLSRREVQSQLDFLRGWARGKQAAVAGNRPPDDESDDDDLD